MRLYLLCATSLDEAIDVFYDRERSLEVLEGILADEPEWHATLKIIEVEIPVEDLMTTCPN